MFTVKHVGDTFTSLWETSRILYERNTDGPIVDRISFVSDGCEVIIQSGSVFVMNEHGKTVDQYHFERGVTPQEPPTPPKRRA